MRIVIVCTGNLCRSPMAEGLLRTRLQQAGRTDIEVSSMGVNGLSGYPADPLAEIVCAEHGIDISKHRARKLVSSELEQAQLVFVMDLVQKDILGEFCPLAEKRAFLLASWPGQERLVDVVPDPVGRSITEFRRVFGLIDNHVSRIMDALGTRPDVARHQRTVPAP